MITGLILGFILGHFAGHKLVEVAKDLFDKFHAWIKTL